MGQEQCCGWAPVCSPWGRIGEASAGAQRGVGEPWAASVTLESLPVLGCSGDWDLGGVS